MKIDENTNAIVIGGGGAIGRGTALGLARRGAKVVIADIELDSAEEVAAELVAKGGEALAVRVDATDESSIVALADRAEVAFGEITLLSNNVGVVVVERVLDADDAMWGWAIEFNLMSIVRCCRVIAPRMCAHGRAGHVVNTASMAGLWASKPEEVGGVNLGLYTATKYAVVGYTETLRGELADHNIGVSVLCPGTVDSDLMATSLRNRPERYGGPEVIGQTKGIVPHAMSSDEVGAYVLAGIEANRMHILTHQIGRKFVDQRYETVTKDFDFYAEL